MNKQMTFDSRIIEHMGKDLITAPEVALVELIKNSIDAGSHIVNIKIFSMFDKDIVVGQNSSLDENVMSYCKNNIGQPCILVEDFGDGMNESLLDEGFLRVGTQVKLNQNDILFGQKGIGRLASQRLGNTLVVETTQAEEEKINVVIIDWNKVQNSDINHIDIPYYSLYKADISKSFTRLWILDARIDDIVSRPQQENIFDDVIALKPDVSSALIFLVSPFYESEKINIKVEYNKSSIPLDFQKEYLKVAESIHSFRLYRDEIKGMTLELKMTIAPFYIEKIHKTRLGNEVDFSRYKLTSEQYEGLYKKYKKRYETTLCSSIKEEELIKYFEKQLNKSFKIKRGKDNKVKFDKYIHDLATKNIINLAKISEISGEIYSFKRDNQVGSLYLDFVQETENILKNVTVKDIQSFLKLYNGVKLYRNNYRVGFLGNRDNDWIEMQQYRTMGQQFYRFNLGDTLGYVKVNDPKQDYIKEISSRLDIYMDDIAYSFKDFVNYIFNDHFYRFNKAADEITRCILLEENLIDKRLPEKVTNASKETEELLKQNKKLIERIKRTKQLLDKNAVVDGNTALIPTEVFNETIEVLQGVGNNADKTQSVIIQSQKLLSEATVYLDKIEIEAFNNYKLMANGLLTETITHELHSLVNNEANRDLETYWQPIEDCIIKNSVSLYNNEFIALKDKYETVMDKICDVSNLYNLLEGTFIKKGSKAAIDYENIEETINRVQKNLNKDLVKQKISVEITNLNYALLLPKGVLLHVFYNLMTNSQYWIDYRRKKSRTDKIFFAKEKDYIRINGLSDGSIEFYDSGTGVLKNMEYILFEALQSGKDNNEGRGMGLYIVKKLLQSFDADIYLAEERNIYGNRYKFIIDLPIQ